MSRKCSRTRALSVIGAGWDLSSVRAGAQPFAFDEEANERLAEEVEGPGRGSMSVARDVVEKVAFLPTEECVFTLITAYEPHSLTANG